MFMMQLSEVKTMEYMIQKLGKLAGISTRTLRYYDQIGLLKPVRTSSSGYRIYGPAEVDKLQQVLFYRELGLPLETIRDIVNASSFEPLSALRYHREQLAMRREQLETLIRNVDKTIQVKEGERTMSDSEKFEGIKQQLIDENEKKYGSEIREKYGEDTVNRSNEKVKHMTETQYKEAAALAESILDKLAHAVLTGDPASPLAQEAADLHRQWLCYFWPAYSKQAHAGVSQMYVDDERFTAYYDARVKGGAKFLRDAVRVYTGMDE
jgi:DNA-binding transcriptional MerR regulator